MSNDGSSSSLILTAQRTKIHLKGNVQFPTDEIKEVLNKALTIKMIRYSNCITDTDSNTYRMKSYESEEHMGKM